MRTLFAAGAALALLSLTACGSTGGSAAPSATSTAPGQATTTSAVAPPSAAATPATSAPVSQPQAAPSKPASDPRCVPADDALVSRVESGFSESGLSLINGTVINSGPVTLVGGSTVDASGKVKNRSDVWVMSNGTVYASTGGARNTTTFAKASDAPLRILPGDERVQALDACVVNLTR